MERKENCAKPPPSIDTHTSNISANIYSSESHSCPLLFSINVYSLAFVDYFHEYMDSRMCDITTRPWKTINKKTQICHPRTVTEAHITSIEASTKKRNKRHPERILAWKLNILARWSSRIIWHTHPSPSALDEPKE